MSMSLFLSYTKKIQCRAAKSDKVTNLDKMMYVVSNLLETQHMFLTQTNPYNPTIQEAEDAW